MKRLSFLTKKNLFLVLSAASFFGLYNSPGVGYAVGFVLALLILILYLSQYTTSPEQRHSIPFSVFILLSALGISWCGAIRFVYTLTSDPGFHSLSEILPEKKALSLAILLLMLSLYFICWCLSLFWERLFTLVKEAELYELQINDVITFEKCGAYSITESSSLFLSRDMPAVYIQENGNMKKVRGLVNSSVINSPGYNV